MMKCTLKKCIMVAIRFENITSGMGSVLLCKLLMRGPREIPIHWRINSIEFTIGITSTLTGVEIPAVSESRTIEEDLWQSKIPHVIYNSKYFFMNIQIAKLQFFG